MDFKHDKPTLLTDITPGIAQSLPTPQQQPEHRSVFRHLGQLFSRQNKQPIESALINPTAGLTPEQAQVVRKKIKDEKKALQAFERQAKRIAYLDKEIVRVQQANRTTFKLFRKPHVYLCMRSNLYHQLHLMPFASQFNIMAVVLFCATFVSSVVISYNPSIKVQNKPVFVNYIK